MDKARTKPKKTVTQGKASKKNPQKMAKEISSFDRFQALARIPEFIEEFDRINKLNRGKSAFDKVFDDDNGEKDFLKKWGLKFMIDPRSVNKETGDGLFEDYKSPVELVPHRITPDEIDYLREGRYFTIEIDSQANKEELLKIIKGLIGEYKRNSRAAYKTKPTLKQNPTLTHWDIYDMVNEIQKCKKVSLDKALELMAIKHFGCTGKPSIDEDTKEHKEQLRYSYKKAVSIFNQVKNA